MAIDDGNGPKERYADLVCEGGGVKGIGLVGAVAELEARGYVFQNLAGTSAGAIVATLLAAGYTAKELYDILIEFDFDRFTDGTFEDNIPIVGQPLSVVMTQGIYRGKAFLDWMRSMLAAKDVRTFGDLIHPAYLAEERYRHRVQVIVSDVTTHELLVLPSDAREKLSIDPDELDVALTVRMSMSIPVFFEPVRFRDGQGRTHIMVDGGMLSNFPVWLFDTATKPEWPTFGLDLVAESQAAPFPAVETVLRPGIRGTVGFLKHLVSTMTDARDRRYIEKAHFARTIPIPAQGVSATRFSLDRQTAQRLYDGGREAARAFLDERWSFEGYIEEFRSGKQQSRSEDIAEEVVAT